MFKKVVWATDGSVTADQALGMARRLVTEAEGELIAVHCVEMTTPGKAGGVYPVYANEDELKEKIEQQLAELTSDGLSTRLRVINGRVGEAARLIAETVREEGAEVIVVGTRGRGPLRGLVLGSVTQRLLHFADCPVLVVPSPAESEGADRSSQAEAGHADR